MELQPSQQVIQLPFTKGVLLDGQSDPSDVSLFSALSEWSDFVPTAIESSGSKPKGHIETHQPDAICGMVDVIQPTPAQFGLPECMNTSNGEDAPSNPVCVVASIPMKESPTSQQSHVLSSASSIAERIRSTFRFPIDLIRNLANRFAVRCEPLTSPKPLDEPVEILGGPSVPKRRKQTDESMFKVLEFIEDNTVVVINQKWMVDSDHVHWPTVPSTRTEHMVREGLSPPKSFRMYPVKVHKALEDYHLTDKLQRVLEDVSESPSSDATIAMDRCGKRPPKPLLLSGSENEENPLTVRQRRETWSPEPPALEVSRCPERTTLAALRTNTLLIPSTSNEPQFTSTPVKCTERAIQR